jgi:hypothetical protein
LVPATPTLSLFHLFTFLLSWVKICYRTQIRIKEGDKNG